MSLLRSVTRVRHCFLSFSKARVLRNLSEGFGYAFVMLNSVTTVCDSLQLVNQLYAQFYFFQSTLLFSVLSLVLEMRNLV